MARWLPAPLLTLALLAGCGEDSEPDSERASAPPPPAAAAAETDESTTTVTREEVEEAEPAASGTRIVVRPSRFGRMLFDSRRQAIYIFDKERRRPACYGACEDAWPPVYAKGTPRAGSGVRRSLLGTVRRKGGRRQVTYAGKPLYYYAHERPGQVLCHNVSEFGGLWLVVGPDGKRRP